MKTHYILLQKRKGIDPWQLPLPYSWLNLSRMAQIQVTWPKTDDTFKPLIRRTSIVAANKREKHFQELLTRAGPYNIKGDLIHLKVMVLRNVAKDAIHVTTLLMKPPLLYLNQQDGNSDKKGRYIHNKKYIWLVAQNLGNKKRVVQCFGNPTYQIIKHIKQSVYSCKIVKHFTEKCKDSIVPIPSFFRYRIVELTWIKFKMSPKQFKKSWNILYCNAIRCSDKLTCFINSGFLLNRLWLKML